MSIGSYLFKFSVYCHKYAISDAAFVSHFSSTRQPALPFKQLPRQDYIICRYFCTNSVLCHYVQCFTLCLLCCETLLWLIAVRWHSPGRSCCFILIVSLGKATHRNQMWTLSRVLAPELSVNQIMFLKNKSVQSLDMQNFLFSLIRTTDSYRNAATLL